MLNAQPKPLEWLALRKIAQKRVTRALFFSVVAVTRFLKYICTGNSLRHTKVTRNAWLMKRIFLGDHIQYFGNIGYPKFKVENKRLLSLPLK